MPVLFSSCIASLVSGSSYSQIEGNISDTVLIFKNEKFIRFDKLPYRSDLGYKKQDTITIFAGNYAAESIIVQKKVNPLVYTNILFGPLGLWGYLVDSTNGVVWMPKKKNFFLNFSETERNGQAQFDFWYDLAEKCVPNGPIFYCLQKACGFVELTDREHSDIYNEFGEILLNKELSSGDLSYYRGRLPYFQRAHRIDSTNELAIENIALVQYHIDRLENEKRERDLAYQQQPVQTNKKSTFWDDLSAFGSALQDIGNSLDGGGTYNNSNSGSSSNSASSNNSGSGSSTGQRTTDPQNCKNLQRAYDGHIKTIQRIFKEWSPDVQYDRIHDQYNRTNKNRDLLRENLRDIDNLKERASRMGCSVKYNSSVENEAQTRVNFRPNW